LVIKIKIKIKRSEKHKESEEFIPKREGRGGEWGTWIREEESIR
jgi:hypothetical protein